MGVRVALVHDYLTQFGGAEQVLAALQRVFPDATTFTTLYDPAADLPGIDRAHVDESRLGKVRWFRQHHRAALPLFPMAMRDIRRRLDDYDVVIADSSAWAHQIKPKPGQAFVVYCHSPARFLYGDADYLGATGVEGLMARAFHSAFAPFRWLDRRAYRRADVVLANSRQVAGRLAKRIGISASVLNPPIDVAQFVSGSPTASGGLVSRRIPTRSAQADRSRRGDRDGVRDPGQDHRRWAGPGPAEGNGRPNSGVPGFPSTRRGDRALPALSSVHPARGRGFRHDGSRGASVGTARDRVWPRRSARVGSGWHHGRALRCADPGVATRGHEAARRCPDQQRGVHLQCPPIR